MNRIAKRIPALAAFIMTAAHAQAPTTRDLMLDLIHPASNDLLLVINRNGPSTAQEWSAARRNALTLTEAGSLLMPQVNSDVWRAAAKELSDAGAHAYKAAQTKDIKALADATARIDASCTTCHKQFRPNVFPKQGA